MIKGIHGVETFGPQSLQHGAPYAQNFGLGATVGGQPVHRDVRVNKPGHPLQGTIHAQMNLARRHQRQNKALGLDDIPKTGELDHKLLGHDVS